MRPKEEAGHLDVEVRHALVVDDGGEAVAVLQLLHLLDEPIRLLQRYIPAAAPHHHRSVVRPNNLCHASSRTRRSYQNSCAACLGIRSSSPRSQARTGLGSIRGSMAAWLALTAAASGSEMCTGCRVKIARDRDVKDVCDAQRRPPSVTAQVRPLRPCSHRLSASRHISTAFEFIMASCVRTTPALNRPL